MYIRFRIDPGSLARPVRVQANIKARALPARVSRVVVRAEAGSAESAGNLSWSISYSIEKVRSATQGVFFLASQDGFMSFGASLVYLGFLSISTAICMVPVSQLETSIVNRARDGRDITLFSFGSTYRKSMRAPH